MIFSTRGGARNAMCEYIRAMRRFCALLLALAPLALQANPPTAMPVTVHIDAATVVGALPPIWRFFGADEPNYATHPEGEGLLLTLGSLRPGQVYFRAHN